MTERSADLFRRVADRIERDPDSYDQATWVRIGECGTVACIGGHALLEAGEAADRTSTGGWAECHALAQTLLGLTDRESILFHARWRPAPGMTVPDALRRLADGWPLAVVTETCSDPVLVAERDEWVKAHA
jgi:hypothetical protein